jgi:hypothetical protein
MLITSTIIRDHLATHAIAIGAQSRSGTGLDRGERLDQWSEPGRQGTAINGGQHDVDVSIRTKLDSI